jgi:hypothetical protein
MFLGIVLFLLGVGIWVVLYLGCDGGLGRRIESIVCFGEGFVGAVMTLTGILMVVVGGTIALDVVTRPPICEVKKVPLDVDVYIYQLHIDGEEVAHGDNVKPFLEKCSQIQRKKKWMETHKEEVLMEVE